MLSKRGCTVGNCCCVTAVMAWLFCEYSKGLAVLWALLLCGCCMGAVMACFFCECGEGVAVLWAFLL